PVMTLHSSEGEVPIDQALVEILKQAYPNVNVMQQLHEIRMWLHLNPAQRKPAKSIRYFINHWLSRSARVQEKKTTALHGASRSVTNHRSAYQQRSQRTQAQAPVALHACISTCFNAGDSANAGANVDANADGSAGDNAGNNTAISVPKSAFERHLEAYQNGSEKHPIDERIKAIVLQGKGKPAAPSQQPEQIDSNKPVNENETATNHQPNTERAGGKQA
ncbi:hypothetical protein RCJ22_39580, partial [Vibrio sp. FNV 38]|nr:hypothetical protein [Vibrio sp. FNV 38]